MYYILYCVQLLFTHTLLKFQIYVAVWEITSDVKQILQSLEGHVDRIGAIFLAKLKREVGRKIFCKEKVKTKLTLQSSSKSSRIFRSKLEKNAALWASLFQLLQKNYLAEKLLGRQIIGRKIIGG